jgi:hypothetical protein
MRAGAGRGRGAHRAGGRAGEERGAPTCNNKHKIKMILNSDAAQRSPSEKHTPPSPFSLGARAGAGRGRGARRAGGRAGEERGGT